MPFNGHLIGNMSTVGLVIDFVGVVCLNDSSIVSIIGDDDGWRCPDDVGNDNEKTMYIH